MNFWSNKCSLGEQKRLLLKTIKTATPNVSCSSNNQLPTKIYLIFHNFIHKCVMTFKIKITSQSLLLKNIMCDNTAIKMFNIWYHADFNTSHTNPQNIDNQQISWKDELITAQKNLYMWPCSTKAVISNTGIFVAIANNTLYGSKLSIFLLWQKSLGY